MSSHNPRPGRVVKKEDVLIEAEHEEARLEASGEVRVLDSTIVDVNELSIADDVDEGNDPYNRTGQHAIIQSGTGRDD